MRKRAKLAWAVGAVLVAAAVFVLTPIAYVETACRGTPAGSDYRPIITQAEWQRPESRTFLTYPEWHMVYAYEDFAKVLETGDEHAFGFLSSVTGFWSSYCALNRMADAHGGADWPTRQMIYTIGTSFNIEMAAKALYEETIGGLAALIRGDAKTPQDTVAAEMAADYGAFLHQTPWYEFPFDEWTSRLWAAPTTGLRSWERRLALGGEWKAKQAYAGLIKGAVESTGKDELRIRSVVADVPADQLASLPGVSVIGTQDGRSIIDSDRYAAYTILLKQIAFAGGNMVEIAGNDDIMVSIVQRTPASELVQGSRLVHTFRQRADGGVRMLVLLKVSSLSDALRAAERSGIQVEHVFDY